MKTILSIVSMILCAAVFICIFVFTASLIQIMSSQYLIDIYEWAILILDFAFFTIIMMGMLYTMNVFDRMIG